jgi:hypothetical protein
MLAHKARPNGQALVKDASLHPPPPLDARLHAGVMGSWVKLPMLHGKRAPGAGM